MTQGNEGQSALDFPQLFICLKMNILSIRCNYHSVLVPYDDVISQEIGKTMERSTTKHAQAVRIFKKILNYTIT